MVGEREIENYLESLDKETEGNSGCIKFEVDLLIVDDKDLVEPGVEGEHLVEIHESREDSQEEEEVTTVHQNLSSLLGFLLQLFPSNDLLVLMCNLHRLHLIHLLLRLGITVLLLLIVLRLLY